MPMLKCNVERTTWTFRLVRVNYSPHGNRRGGRELIIKQGDVTRIPGPRSALPHAPYGDVTPIPVLGSLIFSREANI